jgi:AcrR family transcriptional regulator
MDMEELSKRSGLGKQLIYRYMRAGLFMKPIKAGFREAVFNEEHLAVLQRIRQLRGQGASSFAQIRDLLNLEQWGQEKGAEDALQWKKEQIMDKAISLFSKNGFAETKVSDITDALGVAKGTFYLYFRSKKDLFLECIGRLTMIIIPGELWESVRKERDFVERQRMKLKQFLIAFPTFSGILNLLRLSFQSDDPGLAKKARDTYRLLAGPLMKDLRRAVVNKEARQINVEVVSLLLMGMAENLGYLTMIDPRYSPEEGQEVLLDFMRRGLLAPTPETSGGNEKRWAITDKRGLVVTLEDLRIGGEAFLVGTLGEGEVRVPMENLLKVEIQGGHGKCTALVTIGTGEAIALDVDEGVALSGKSSFGDYSVPLGRISVVSPYNPAQ